MYKINPSLCSACFLLCSDQVFTAWAGAGPKKSIIDHLPQSVLAGIPTIISYCEDIRDKVFNAALGNKDNKLNKPLTEANKAPYLLRNHRPFALPKWKIDRFKNTFILSSCLNYNWMIRFECFYILYAWIFNIFNIDVL